VPQPDLDAQRDEAPLRHVDVLLQHMVEEQGLQDVPIRAGEVNMHEGAEAGDVHLGATPVVLRKEVMVVIDVTIRHEAVRLLIVVSS